MAPKKKEKKYSTEKKVIWLLLKLCFQDKIFLDAESELCTSS